YNTRPCAVFASPNFIEGQENHLMGLFLPSCPKWVRENRLESEDKFFFFRKGAPLKLDCRIAVLASAKQSLDCVDRWFTAFGVPKPAQIPRGDYRKEIEFSMKAYLESLWIEPEQKWWTSKGAGDLLSLKALPPHYAFLLKLAALDAADEGLRKKYTDRAELAVQLGKFMPAGDDLGFTWGDPAAGLQNLASAAAAQLDTMREDGSWRFKARVESGGVFKGRDYALLGTNDAAEIGTCARNAYEIARFARMTGDAEVFKSVEKSFAFMDRFQVPRAAQVWECPVHSPDILASADAVDAYLEAFAFTGDKRYLDKAVYWARTGLPFVYMWNPPEMPMLRHASIALYGGSWFDGTWIGQPVQWNGLRYAYALLKLWEHDKSFPWRQVAEGLTISAMYQQDTSGANVALWPDNFSAVDGTKCGWVFEPGLILKNVYKLLDWDLEPATYAVAAGPGRLLINTRGKVSGPAWAEGKLQFEIRFPEHVGGYVAIAGMDRPAKVVCGQEELPQREHLCIQDQPGWMYRPDLALLVLRVCSGGPHAITVEGARHKSVSLLPPYAESVAFDFTDGLQGWVVANAVESLVAENGIMKGTATGADPYLSRTRCRIDGNSCHTVLVRVKASAGGDIALYWTTKDSPNWSEEKAVHRPLVPGGEFVEIDFNIGAHPEWNRKKITSLRLDPTGGCEKATFEVDFIKGE
ncbi:MAG: hypothetical protein RDV41_07480, partial [Planctomycetota bacterium]|nr:hypothetical protein [Planctomycetota bacterium]